MAIGTYIISAATVNITSDMGVMVASVQATSGTVTLLGAAEFTGLTNAALTLTVGQPVVLPALTNVQPLSGITIDATNGVAELLLG